MNCQTFGQTIQNCLDERTPLNTHRELGLHAAVCPSCNSELRRYRMLEQLCQPSTLMARLPERPAAPVSLPDSSLERPRKAHPSRLANASPNSWVTSCCLVILAAGVLAVLPKLKSLSSNEHVQARHEATNLGPVYAANRPSIVAEPNNDIQIAAESSRLAQANSNRARLPGTSAFSLSGLQAGNNLDLGELSWVLPGWVETPRALAVQSTQWFQQTNASKPPPRRTLASLRQCYEVTAELPGIRPLESSLQWAINALQQTFTKPIDQGSLPQSPNSSSRPLQSNKNIA